MEGLTVPEIAQTLGIKETTVRQRLMKVKIKPLSQCVLYPKSALETIKGMGAMGRPKKEEAGEEG
jgi:predicted ArsR family transcriptional regulator